MSKKAEDLVRFISQRLATYIDTPKEVRTQRRSERRQQKSAEPWSSRWFGLVPVSFRLWFGSLRTKKRSALRGAGKGGRYEDDNYRYH